MPAHIHAVLGPTNTGKTHYALTRMVAHSSGIIGFPLRLLARENYERLVALKGERHVALITGEEKIIPPTARWFSCTAEAMPLDRRVDFMAVDEIQLATDPERGHIFTNRILHARGQEETLLLGAESMRGLLRQLVPGIKIETRPRLSQLAHTGPLNLVRLPPRSAIVAFSAPEVYAIAETIRQKRGGCAIIMGRLSPRTRNAQIALYQNREVDYLVATDAIGMGLNMDINHVALAALHKFDGQHSRLLTPQDVAQIVGRAGRGMRDGTFGTTGTCPPMSHELVNAVEEHRFPPIRHIHWRQADLDYSSPTALLHSLMQKPPYPGLIRGRAASDLEILQDVLHQPDIRALAKGRKATALLWDFCQIPDFRKLADGSHARLCGRLFLDMIQHGHIPAAWLDGQLHGLDRTEGDIDTLMHRLTAVRVCAYVAARSDWIRQSTLWQQRSQAVEERLSDALHERLTARFVNRRSTALLRRRIPDEGSPLLHAVTSEDRIVVEGHDIGCIRGFSLETDLTDNTEEAALMAQAGRQALRQVLPQRIQRFLADPPDTLALSTDGQIIWKEAPIALLKKGERFFQPSIQLLSHEFHDNVQIHRVKERIRQFVAGHLYRQLHHFLDTESILTAYPALRGLFHRLWTDGGMTQTLPADQHLSGKERALLRTCGIIVGIRHSFAVSLLKPSVMPLMTLLASLWHERSLVPPPSGRLSLPADQSEHLPGWVNAGPVGLRVDGAERILRLARTRNHPHPAPPHLTSLLGVKKALVPEILQGLGIPHCPARPLPARYYGPAAPLMLMPARATNMKRKRMEGTHKNRPNSRRTDDSPFAMLVQWEKMHLKTHGKK